MNKAEKKISRILRPMGKKKNEEFKRLQEQNEKLQKDLEKAVKCLEFYGDKEKHKHKRITGENGEDVLLAPAFLDQGRRARACLEELRK